MSSRRSSLRGVSKLVAARRFSEAEKAAWKLIEAGGADLPLVNLFASVLQKQGKYKPSETWFDRSLRNSPNQFHVLVDQTKNKMRLGKRREASFLASKAADLSSGSFSDSLKVAEAYLEIGVPAAAIEFFNKALNLDPNSVEAHVGLGRCRNLRMNKLAARNHFLKAVELNPLHVGANIELGRSLFSWGDYSGAVSCFEAVLRARPKHVAVLIHLAKAHFRRREIDKAIAYVRKAIALNPTSTVPLYQLSEMKRFTPGDPDMAHMEQLLAALDGSQGSGKRIDLSLALAKANEDCGNYSKACDLYLDAKRLARQRAPYSIEDAKRHFARVKEVFDPGTIASIRARGISGYSPIFVVGLPRSGKTSVAEVIGVHPRAVVEPEHVGLGWFARKLIPTGDGPFDAEKIRNALLQSKGAPGGGSLASLEPGVPRPPIKVSNSPENLWALGAIEMMFQDAKVIHCVREPLSHCVSLFKCTFSKKLWGFSNSIDNTIEYMKLYDDLMTYWKSVLNTQIYEVRYDDLVARGEAGLSDLLEASDLDIAEVPRPLPKLSLGTTWDDGMIVRQLASPTDTGERPTVAEAEAILSERKMLEAFTAKVPSLREWTRRRVTVR